MKLDKGTLKFIQGICIGAIAAAINDYIIPFKDLSHLLTFLGIIFIIVVILEVSISRKIQEEINKKILDETDEVKGQWGK